MQWEIWVRLLLRSGRLELLDTILARSRFWSEKSRVVGEFVLLSRGLLGCFGRVASKRVMAAGIVAVAVIAVSVLLVWIFRDELGDLDVKAAVDWIASFGPVPFFVAMSILPCLWAPVSPFLLLAGALYDLPVAIAGCALALTANQAFCWLLAGKLFRPLFERLAHRFGYSIPEINRSSMITVAVLLRITPGVPFPFQNYLLGLARMPFIWYIAISAPLTTFMATSIILFGDAILKGNVGVALLAVSLFIGISLGVRQLRRRLNRKATEEAEG